jgi:hypothetical protein
LRRATKFDETLAVALHLGVVFEPVAHFFEDACRVRVGWLDDAVVHPFAFASRLDDARTAQVSEVPGNLRLIGSEDFDKETDADLVSAHQVQKPQSRVISQRAEEHQLVIKSPLRSTHENILAHRQQICLDKYVGRAYPALIFVKANMKSGQLRGEDEDGNN